MATLSFLVACTISTGKLTANIRTKADAVAALGFAAGEPKTHKTICQRVLRDLGLPTEDPVTSRDMTIEVMRSTILSVVERDHCSMATVDAITADIKRGRFLGAANYVFEPVPAGAPAPAPAGAPASIGPASLVRTPRRRRAPAPAPGPAPAPAPAAAPAEAVAPAEPSEENLPDCPMCFEPIRADAVNVMILACGHKMHLMPTDTCVGAFDWIVRLDNPPRYAWETDAEYERRRNKATCPCCRRSVRP
jgi:hypothetical protein